MTFRSKGRYFLMTTCKRYTVSKAWVVDHWIYSAWHIGKRVGSGEHTRRLTHPLGHRKQLVAAQRLCFKHAQKHFGYKGELVEYRRVA